MATKDKLPSNAEIWGCDTWAINCQPKTSLEPNSLLEAPLARAKPTRKAPAAKKPATRKKQRRSK